VSNLGPLGRFVRYGDCLLLLVSRALKVRYRRSVLGFGWSLLYPLLAMTVLWVVFGRVFPEIEHYALYVIIGVLAWSFFSVSCVQAMDSLHHGAPLLRKVYLPAALFPAAAVGANLVNLVLSIALLPLVIWLTGARPGFHPFVLCLAVFAIAAFTVGVALALSAWNLLFHDIRYFFDALLLIWFYASPIVYPAGIVPSGLRAFLWLNPFYWLLELLRAALYAGAPPSWALAGVATGLGVSAMVAGWWVFTRLENRFYLYL